MPETWTPLQWLAVWFTAGFVTWLTAKLVLSFRATRGPVAEPGADANPGGIQLLGPLRDHFQRTLGWLLSLQLALLSLPAVVIAPLAAFGLVACLGCLLVEMIRESNRLRQGDQFSFTTQYAAYGSPRREFALLLALLTCGLILAWLLPDPSQFMSDAPWPPPIEEVGHWGLSVLSFGWMLWPTNWSGILPGLVFPVHAEQGSRYWCLLIVIHIVFLSAASGWIVGVVYFPTWPMFPVIVFLYFLFTFNLCGYLIPAHYVMAQQAYRTRYFDPRYHRPFWFMGSEMLSVYIGVPLLFAYQRWMPEAPSSATVDSWSPLDWSWRFITLCIPFFFMDYLTGHKKMVIPRRASKSLMVLYWIIFVVVSCIVLGRIFIAFASWWFARGVVELFWPDGILHWIGTLGIWFVLFGVNLRTDPMMAFDGGSKSNTAQSLLQGGWRVVVGEVVLVGLYFGLLCVVDRGVTGRFDLVAGLLAMILLVNIFGWHPVKGEATTSTATQSVVDSPAHDGRAPGEAGSEAR